jgi:hypothetical protein
MSLRNRYLSESFGRRLGEVNPAVHPIVPKVLMHLTLDRAGPGRAGPAEG